MKNTSILIPIILIGCLTALGFLLYKAVQSVEEEPARTNRQIVLNEADYADDPAPADVGATTDYGAAGNTDDGIVPDPAERAATTMDATAGANEDGNEMVEMTAAERRAALEEDRLEAKRLDREESAAQARQRAADEAARVRSNGGRYLVIAGSFRQRSNAEERVEALISAGFKDTRLERFNRGTYAVALAGQSNRYSTANQMAADIRKAGFEARVMRRR